MATQGRKERKKLSKHLLEMKFMRSSKDRIEQEEAEEDCRLIFSDHISDELKQSSSRYITENSFVVCEGLVCGRKSFRGMNPELERILELEFDEKTGVSKIKEEDVDVSIDEMVKFQREESTLVETVAKKFRKSNSEPESAPAKKSKFMKPPED